MSNTTEVKILKETAHTVYVSHPKFSYGIFCFNDSGDLFLNSDWGSYSYAWRSYGKDNSFVDFLKRLNPEYVFDKFDTNSRYLMRKGLPKHVQEPVTELVREFINALKNSENE